MCCALAVLGILGPRALIIFWWLVDPVRWNITFNNQLLLPLLGFLFLPWATIMYVAWWTVTGGVPFIGWVFIGFGALIDIGTYGGGAYGNRDKVGYYNTQR